MKKFFVLLTLALAMYSLPALAQQKYDLDHFDGIKSEGPLPSDFRLSLEELYTLDKQRVRDYNDGKLRNRDKVLMASYQINRTMVSGRILYGDPITRMVERIADTLLKDYPELRKELRFYTLKSPDVNAFATGQGMVFVCTGLVSQIEDEAQLAFVLSHEIVHYLRKHSLEEISRRKRDSDDIDAETQEMRDFIKYHNRSREMETEADSLGLAMFYLPSPYSKDVAEGVFDVLQYSYLPFDEVAFDTNYFNTPYFKLPSDCFMDEVDPITARDDYNDSLSTHPNILKRRIATSNIIGNAKGGSRYVTISQSEFEQIQALARFECVRQDIIYSDYVKGFYDCYLLQQTYPDNAYVERALCQSLYGLSKYKTYTNTSSVVGDYKDYEGEVQQCYYLFRHLKKEDLAFVAARQLWKSHCKFPDDKQITDMLDDILADLYKKYERRAESFIAEPPAQQTEDTVNLANLSKYERLKRKKNQQKKGDVHNYIFTDFFQQGPEFKAYLETHLTKPEDKAVDKTLKNKNQLVYCPTYYVISKNSGELNILKSNSSETSLYGHIHDAARKAGIGSIDFSDQSLQNISTAERYNEWVDLNEWVGEFWQTKGDFDMMFSVQPQMDRIVDKYDAGTLNMTIVLNRENIAQRTGVNPISYIWFLPVLPMSVNKLVAHSEATLVYSIQINAREGKRLSRHLHTYDLSDENARLRSALYDHFLHVDTDSISRVPGYMGSRLHFAVSPSFGIGNIFPSTGETSFLRELPISIGIAAELEFIVGRRRALHLTAGYNPSSFFDGNHNHLMNDLGLSLAWRVYKNEAPLGYYWQVGADYQKVVVPEPPDTYSVGANMFGLNLQFGRNHILSDHFLLGYYVRYGFLFGNDFLKGDDANFAKTQTFLSNIIRLGLTLGLVP